MRVHLAAACGAITTITAFLIVGVVSQLAGSPAEIRDVRQLIVAGLPLLIGCLAAAGLTGRRLAGRSRSTLVRRKKRRLAAAAATGLLILVPCALILTRPAAVPAVAVAGLQITEACFGVLNLTLLALNFRDGRQLSRRRPTRPMAPVAGGQQP
ncbi:MAG: hypothetical protein DLM59_06005 [Pseudonocardiales bacterium]|nr:MAG: hypothetical protein DLM59_06005 [Pseudonocardiales bacterium]